MGNALEMHDSRAGRPRGQTRRLAEEQRLRVYHLSLQGYSEGEIAQGLGINQSSVSRMLTLLRRRNAEWFQANKDPDRRYQALFKESYDGITATVVEAWRLYHRTEQAEVKSNLLGRVQHGIGLCCRLLRISAPTLQELHWEQQVADMENRADELKKQLEELRLSRQIIPITGP